MKYVRIASIVFAQVEDDVNLEEVEKEFIDALPDNMLITNCKMEICSDKKE